LPVYGLIVILWSKYLWGILAVFSGDAVAYTVKHDCGNHRQTCVLVNAVSSQKNCDTQQSNQQNKRFRRVGDVHDGGSGTSASLDGIQVAGKSLIC